MAIITQADIENVFGATNVRVWSNLENDSTTADAARITAAIAWAEDYIGSRVALVYAVPIAPTGTATYVLKDVIAKLAGSWLYSSRTGAAPDPNELAVAARRDAEKRIDAWVSGTSDPGLVRLGGRRVTVPSVS